jgi:hypothetical protein
VRIVLGGLFVTALVGSLFLWAFLTIIWPEMKRAQRLTLKEKTHDNLALIGAALRAYHDDYKCFPPAVIRDSAGKPMHSWRVLLLPYLGEKELYRAYKFDEPWDGPTNSTLLIHSMPAVYRDPADPDSRITAETPYLAVCGDGSVFPRDGSVILEEITDGPGDTVMVVEAARSGIAWMEPLDMQITRMNYSVNSNFGPDSVATLAGDGPQILLADGTVKELVPEVSAAQLRALVTIRGGETVHWTSIAK